MSGDAWTAEQPGRLGAGVVLDAQVLWSLRVRDDPEHERVTRRVTTLVQGGLPLVVSYPSLTEVASRLYKEFGPRAATEFVSEARGFLNTLLPTDEDTEAAEGALAQGAERLTLEQAVAGALARRLGCSVYGMSPAYHLFHVALVVD